jgi:replicative DNA helicase
MAAEAVFDFASFNVHGVVPEDFAGENCRIIVAAAREAWELGDSGLDGTVRSLQRAKKLETVGGRDGLHSKLASGGAPDANRLRLLSRSRKVQELAMHAMRFAGEADLAKAMERMQEALSVGLTSSTVKVKTGKEIVETLLQAVGDEARGNAARVYPGVRAIQDAIGNLPIGSCTVIGADSGVGKSSLALEMVIGLSEAGGTAGLISVEDPEVVTGSRLLGSLCGVPPQIIQTGAFGDAQAASIATGVGKVSAIGPRLLFADCTGETDIDVRAAMAQMAARGCKLCVVDYLTEIECSKKQQDRRNEIRWVAKQLKAHARRLGMALVLVSQIARPESKNPNAEPTKHHLKESGDVTNMAEVILMMWRSKESDAADIMVKVVKVKWGGIGKFWKMRRNINGRLVESDQVSDP